MDVKVTELRVENGRVIERKRIDHVPEDKVRDNLLCTRCGVPAYPECQKTCVHYKNHLAMVASK